MSQQNPNPLSPTVVTHAQEEIRKTMAQLRELSEATDMEGWSVQIRSTYHMALDDLAALEAYLEIFKSSLQKNEDGG